jgi:hypothetical protein
MEKYTIHIHFTLSNIFFCSTGGDPLHGFKYNYEIIPYVTPGILLAQEVLKNEAKPTTTPAKKEQQPPIPSQKVIEVITEKQDVSPKKEASFSPNPLAIAAQSTNVTVEQIDQTNNLPITNETHLIAPNQNLNESQLTDIATKTVNPHVKVSASNLLSEVDKELTLSFRQKVIRKIDKNYKTVKLALINRNQQ